MTPKAVRLALARFLYKVSDKSATSDIFWPVGLLYGVLVQYDILWPEEGSIAIAKSEIDVMAPHNFRARAN